MTATAEQLQPERQEVDKMAKDQPGRLERFRRRQVEALPKVGRRQFGDKGALATMYAHENLFVTPEGTWAGFWLPDMNWAGLDQESHDRIIIDGSTRLAELVGHRILLLGKHNPWPVAGVRAALEAQYPNPWQPTNGAPGFADPGTDGQVGGEIDRLQRFMIVKNSRRPFWFIAVRVTRERIERDRLPYLLGVELPKNLAGFVDRRRLYDRVSAIIAGGGMNGRPVSEQTLAWVFRTSIGMKLSTVHVDPEKVMSFEDTIGMDGPVRSLEEPFGAYTKVTGLRHGQQATSYVTVLRAKPLKSIDDTEDREPWLSWSTGLADTEVETAACFDIVGPEALEKDAIRFRRIKKDQIKHYKAHGFEPSDKDVQGEIRAAEVVSELGSREQILNVSAVGQVMYAVAAATPDKLATDVSAFIRRAKAEQSIELEQEIDQWTDYRKFIPGESWSLPKLLPNDKDQLDGYLTVAPVLFLGAGVPHASSAAGDSWGFPLGEIYGSNDLLFHDPFGGARRNRTNSTILIGSPGSSKSATLSAICVFLARGGVPGTLYDPAGTMRMLMRLKSLEGATREIPLTADAPAGILQPHYLVPDPDRADYDTPEEYKTAILQIEAERISLTMTAVLQCINPALLKQQPQLHSEIQDVCSEFPDYGTSMREVLAMFAASDSSGGNELRRVIARQLKTRSRLPDGKLIFPATDTDDAVIRALLTDRLFTLVTMPGMETPPKEGTDPENWTPGQLAARPIHTLGNRFAALSIWTTAGRSWYGADELGLTTGGAEQGAYAAFVRRVLYNSRKADAAVMFAAQTITTMLAIEQELSALVGSVIVSRTSKENALATLPVMGVDTKSGLHLEVPGYADGEVLYSGFDQKTRRAQIDQALWTQELIDLTNTTPKSVRSELVNDARIGWV